MNILEIKNLSVEYYRGKEVIPAVRNVSLNIETGETLSIVGESGSGKSTVAMSIMGLIFPYEGKITAGEIFFEGKNLLNNSAKEWENIRGKDISIIFQDPFSSLNPVIKAGEQVAEAYKTHHSNASAGLCRSEAEKALNDVLLTDTERIYNSYPHQLSGGQRQRIALAMAITNKPKILIADEPTTALDVTIQKEILDLIDRLKVEYNLTVIFITHNLPLAYERSRKIAVMTKGEIAESGNREKIFKSPENPYTKHLIQAVPRI